jgi:glycosyltransferase involved in cell wall biosynthesis
MGTDFLKAYYGARRNPNATHLKAYDIATLTTKKNCINPSSPSLVRAPPKNQMQVDIEKRSATGTPLVSVVMCVYNAGEYLRPSLQSILAQTYERLEIIIIDDGSTDGCIDTIKDLLCDPRIVFRKQENATRPVALNRAIDLVTGDFYAIQDADDISHPKRIEKQVRAFLRHPEVAAVFCGNEIILNGRSMAPTFAPKTVHDCKRDIDALSMPAHDPTGMFRMSLVGDFRYQRLPFVEAVEYIMRIGELYPMIVLGECLYGYRILKSSITRRDPTQREQAVAEMLKITCIRRGLDYDRTLHNRQRNRSENSMRDNNLAAQFVASVKDQLATRNRQGALRTAVECIRLHPADLHYYKPLVHFIVPHKIIALLRRSHS